MRRYTSKVIFVCMMIIFMMGATGCMKKESAADKMVAYMNEKYDDHFEYYAPFGGGPGATTTQIIVKSVKFPDAEIWVEYYTGEGGDVFADNYVSYKYEEQTRETLQELLNDVFHEDVKLRYSVGTNGTINDFTNETTFEEYASNPASFIGFRAFVLDDGSAISFAENELKAAIEDSGFVISGSIFVTNDTAYFDKAFDMSAKELSQIEQLQITMNAPCSFLMYKWR